MCLLPPANSADTDEQWFALRNHNPFLQIFGLPPFQDGTLTPKGDFRYAISLDVANHADASETATESIVLDGETYALGLSLRYGATSRLELGIDIPLIAHSDGILDDAIESWHDLWGMSNSKRSGPGNQLRFFYENPAMPTYEQTSPSFGLGDLQLTAAVPLKKPDNRNKSALAIRSSVKVPTGDAKTLRGSGAFDLSLGLYAADFAILPNHELRFSGFAGVLLPGEGDILPALQRSAIAFGGLGATWQLNEGFSIKVQTYAQGAYLDSDLDEIGGSSVQLALGGTYRNPRRRFSLAFALVEDVFSDATADVALHLSLRRYGGS